MHIHIFREQRLLRNAENASAGQAGNVPPKEDAPQDVTASWETLPQGESMEQAVSHKAEAEVQKIQNWEEIEEAEKQMRKERQKPLRENIDQTIADLPQIFLDYVTAATEHANTAYVKAATKHADTLEELPINVKSMQEKLCDHEETISQIWDELDEPERQQLEQKIVRSLPDAKYCSTPQSKHFDGILWRLDVYRSQGKLELMHRFESIESARTKQFVREQEQKAYDPSRKLNNPDLSPTVDAVSSECQHIDLVLLPGTKYEYDEGLTYTVPSETSDDLIIRMPLFRSQEVVDRAYEQFRKIMRRGRGFGWFDGEVRVFDASPEEIVETLDKVRKFDDELDTLLKLDDAAKRDTSGLSEILIPKREEVGTVFERLRSNEQKELLKESLKHCAFEHQLDLANLVGKLDPDVCRQLLNDGPLRRDQTSKIAKQFQKFTKVEKQLYLRFPIGRIAKKECNPDEDFETSDNKHLIHPGKKTTLGGNS